MKAILILLCGAVLTGCIGPAGNDLNMQGIVGKHCSELAAVRGLPQEKISDGRGGEVWIYIQDRDYVAPEQSTTTVRGYGAQQSHSHSKLNTEYYGSSNQRLLATAETTTTPGSVSRWQVTRSFFIDKDGIIYKFKWNGL